MNQESLQFLSNFKGLHIFVAGDEKRDSVPWHFHKTFEEVYETLAKKNQQDQWGIYFTVNELDKEQDPKRKRTKKMLKRIRAVFCDFDDKTELPKFPIKPSITVQSSPGKFQYYWLTSTDNIEEWTGVQQCIVNEYGGDNQAKDLTRYLRIPGFNHCKRDPVKVELIDNNGKVYDWETIKIAFPPAAKQNRMEADKPTQSETTSGKTIKDHNDDILFGRHFHSPVLAHLQRIKDGDPPYVIKANLHSMFEAACHFKQQWIKSEQEWEHAKSTIDYQVDQYVETIGAIGKQVTLATYVNEIPEFPSNLMAKWPEPWPLIWENYKKLPRTLDECLLLPTIIVIHSFLLNAVYVTDWGKRPNMAFLNIAPSTGNKDVNSENVIRTVLEVMAKQNKVLLPFTKMVVGAEGITSDTAFLQSFTDNDLFWVNTESTHLFQQMAQAGTSNASVKALESKIIDVVDGGPIRGKRKAGKDGNVEGIQDPNAQVLLYAQPETISAYLKGNMVDSGLLGRMILHIPKDNGIDPFLDSFKKREQKNYDMDPRLFTLYEKLDQKTLRKKRLAPSDSDIDKLQEWMIKMIKPLGETDHSIKLLKRLAISAEQLYVVILGICQKWDEAGGNTKRKSFDPTIMLPLLEYWAKCKMYVLNEYIDNSADPLADSIIEIVAQLIGGKIKPKAHNEWAKKNHVVPKSEVYRVIRSRTKLKRELEARSDNRNVRQRVYYILDMLAKEGVIIETTNKQTTYIGFGPNYEE